MPGIIIQFEFDQVQPDPGDICSKCKEVIIEIKYIPFLQIGGPENVIHFEGVCQLCYDQLLPDTEEKNF
jgi:hypothetical protein